MSNVPGKAGMDEGLSRELYFLIVKFLSEGPCSAAAEVLKNEVERHQLLPKGINWLGQETPRNFKDTVISNPHISSDFLQNICQRLIPLLEQTIPPSVKGVSSLLGAGRQSLLRPSQDVGCLLTSDHLSVCRHGAPIAPGYKTKNTFSLTNVVKARETSGTSCKRNFLQHGIYAKMSMHRRILGHLSAVYCVLFDQTGHSIITGADDNLVKIWASSDGRLLATLRGHSAEISDIAINFENTLIAAGSCDKTIRVWDSQTSAPVGVLQGHTGTITSLQFCPSCFGDIRYLMSTGGDATVSFWKYDLSTYQFDPIPVKFQEKSRPGAQIICSSFSPGGGFLVTGNTDHNIRIYQISPGPPERIAELTSHIDHVDSIQFSHTSERFLSGSRDGAARIWYFQRSEWKSHVLNNVQRLSSTPREEETNKITKLRVTMVGWDLCDQHVITAVNDHTIKVWESNSGILIYVLKGHQDEVFVIEAHPTDPYILLTAGHDGYIILWNLATGKMVKSFYNSLQGQGHGAVFDCKFSPDGQKFASTDSHGHLAIYGFGSSEPYQKVPEEQFFHTDYRPVMRDMNNHVLDEQTQTAPHLMPPPFLVDVDGNPHPVFYQRLIPGHSSNIRPQREVTSPPPVPSSPMPSLLAEIEQFERAGVPLNPEGLRSPPPPPPGNNNAAARPLLSPGLGSRNRGLLQDGDIEGVRQLNVNIPIIQDATEADIHAWRNRTIVPKLKSSAAKWDEEKRLTLGRQELMKYLREKKKRPLPSTSRPANQTDQKAERFLRSRARRANRRDRSRPAESRPVYNTRAAANNGSGMEESGDDVMITPSESDEEEEDEAWNSSSSESSEYSDWTEEVGLSTRHQAESQRPSRRVRRVLSSSDEEAETTLQQEVRPAKKESDKPKKTVKKKKKAPRKPRITDHEEWLEYYRPPDWMTSTKTQWSPYVPQVGDEVYYFRQGHELYVNEVLSAEAYDINAKKQCYSKLDLKAEELCKVVSLHCVIGPPTLMSLKLAILNPETGTNTGGTFTVKYHDMADVLDFFVLKQYYDQSLQRDWRPGSRFRSVIDDCWWSGIITEVSPYEDALPESHYQCYVVSWDTGEVERMSPWDLEPVPDDDPSTPNESEANTSGVASSNIPITDEEHEALVKYIPQDNEWPDEEHDAAITRLTRGLSILSELPFAGPFAYPVDVQAYPDYWSVVADPVDLSTIVDRLINKYYRRKPSLLWDVCQIGRNAKAYNEEDSEIVQNAQKLVSVLSRFVRDPTCVDPLTLCDDANLENTEVDIENLDESDSEKQTAEGPSRSNKRKNTSSPGSLKKKARRSEEDVVEEYSLNEEMLTLLNMLATRSDAEPFRENVDAGDFPDYCEYVDESICFSTIRERIANNYYKEPDPFIRDVKLVFSNSRKYNTNPKSRIYSMTIRLSALFQTKVDELLLNFYRDRTGSGRRTRLRSRQPAEEQPGPSGLSSSPRRAVTPRVRPELVPRSSTRISSRRGSNNDDGAGPSGGETESLRMRISLSRGSVVSTTGLGDLKERGGGGGGSSGTSHSTAGSSSSRHQPEVASEIPSEESAQRTRAKSRTSYRGESGPRTDAYDETPNASNASSLNGPSTRYSTRLRGAVARNVDDVNGVSETADHDSDDYDEEGSAESEEDSGEESSEGSEGGSPQERETVRSSRSGKAPVSRKGAGKKAASRKGKRVVPRARARVSESDEPARSSRRTGLRNHASTRYVDMASESDDEPSVNEFIDVSSRGRVRRKASRMLGYVN